MTENVKVAVFGTGQMGSGIIKRILQKTGLDLVGGYGKRSECSGTDVGKDIGYEQSIDVKITNDLPGLLEGIQSHIVIQATCPKVIQAVDEINTALNNGAHIISIAEEVAFPAYKASEVAEEIHILALESSVTVLGTGINPGFVLDLLVKNTELQTRNAELEAKNVMLADREVHLMHLVEEKTQKVSSLTIALINALENANLLNDSDTGKHIKRVSAYSAFLAEQYGCERDFVKRIALYASLHDVGKVGLPDAILKKPGTYTEEEFLAMQQHVVIGAKMLENEEIDLMARNIALYHHEWWDGTGYVNQLTHDDIPLEARIVSLADVYDALTTERVYKGAFSEEKAEEIIAEESGTHFDPTLVELFLENTHTIKDIKRSVN
jgi:putative nucleotidyltransferase with HDIG domain